MTFDASIRLHVYGDIIERSIGLSFWHFDEAMRMKSTTNADPELLENFLTIGGCKEMILDYCEENKAPCAFTDRLNLVWLTVPIMEDEESKHIFLLGPAFNSFTTEESLLQDVRRLGVSDSLKLPLLQRLKKLPTLQHSTLMNYGVMLYYAITEQVIEESDIQFRHYSMPKRQMPVAENELGGSAKSVFAFEQIYFTAVTQGNVDFRQPTYVEPTTMGVLSVDDPLRNVKNQMVLKVGLSCRAAIYGGLPEETAYSLSDRYIQMIETCETVPEAYECGDRGYREMIERVHKFKQASGRSREIQTCLAYLEEHLTEKIDYNDLALYLGYNRRYLCTKFKQEMDCTIGDYILKQRIKYAKLLLRNSQYSILEISQLFQFNSSSYFSSVFHREVGMSPKAYRDTGDMLSEIRREAM